MNRMFWTNVCVECTEKNHIKWPMFRMNIQNVQNFRMWKTDVKNEHRTSGDGQKVMYRMHIQNFKRWIECDRNIE